MSNRARKLEFFETWGTFLWFLMDAAWMFQLESLSYTIIPLAVMCNLAIFLYIGKSAPYFIVTAAVNFWLFMNICWMINDFNKELGLVIYSKTFFTLGVICIIGSIFGKKLDKPNNDAWKDAFRRFRRFRIGPH